MPVKTGVGVFVSRKVSESSRQHIVGDRGLQHYQNQSETSRSMLAETYYLVPDTWYPAKYLFFTNGYV